MICGSRTNNRLGQLFEQRSPVVGMRDAVFLRRQDVLRTDDGPKSLEYAGGKHDDAR